MSTMAITPFLPEQWWPAKPDVDDLRHATAREGVAARPPA
jgi:hypothetical protein